MELWPHQVRAIEQTLAAIANDVRRLGLTAPTGAGKSLVMANLTEGWVSAGLKVAIYSNRRSLIRQLHDSFDDHRIPHGIRAAGWPDEREKPVQICSIQTEGRRRKAKKEIGGWELHEADRVLVDEGHLFVNPTATEILNAHHAAGAAYVLVTATPLGLAPLCDQLIVAGTTSELRKCGALVPALHYGPDEPDLKHIGKVALGEDLTEEQNRKAIMTPTIFSRVLESYATLNPERKPSILFAPGVAESIWFAERLTEAGIRAAHIDGEDVWIDGELHKSHDETRKKVFAAAKCGDVKVICNRFVLREGIDLPWLEHGILATVLGSLQSYIQVGGRLLRASPSMGKTHAVIQDHGGNWHRHGSLNSDREWRLEYTAPIVAGLRAERLREKREREPVLCPKCKMVLSCPTCPCGYRVEGKPKSRPVIQSDGTLKEMTGDIYRPRRTCQAANAAALWERMYYRALSRKWNATFRQAEARFAEENQWGWPSRDLPLMPVRPLDFFNRVKDVPPDRLRGDQATRAKAAATCRKIWEVAEA